MANKTMHHAVIGSDTYEIVDEQARDGKSSAIYCTTSGSLVTIPDGADSMPLKSLTVGIEPVQAGTGDPSPQNIRAISGWTSAKIHRTKENLLGGMDFANQVQRYIPSATIDTDEKTVGFGAGASIVTGVGFLTGGLPFKENTAYTFIFYGKNTYAQGSSSTNMRITYTDGTNQNFTFAASDGSLSYAVAVTNPNKTVAYLMKNNQRTGTLLYYDQCGIFEGTLTADDFVPYTGTTYDITFPSEAGTVYGGTLDVTNGTLTVDKEMKTITAISAMSATGGYAYLTVGAKGYVKDGAETICNMLKYLPSGSMVTAENSIRTLNSSGYNQAQIVFRFDSTYQTKADYDAKLAELNTAGTPMVAVYELATPVTITLDPVTIRTLLGLNNIWADTGAIEEVTYAADTKMYIDGLTQPDEDMVANSNITSGAYFSVNNKLYLATAAIAAGETIVPGTNCTETNLADALNTIISSNA